MRVLEIGCGLNPGPFIEGATEHVALDCDPNLVQQIALPFTPRLGDGASLTDSDGSFEMVLACNVLGDPELGMTERQTRNAEQLKAMSLLDGDMRTYREIMSGIHRAVNGTKDLIVAEAIRVLRPGGKFVVVERFTPDVAVSYINEAIAQARIARLEKVDPQSVLPASYLARNNKIPDVWTIERS